MNEKICRLCLQAIKKNNFQKVDEPLLKSLKLNISISKENVMCIECATGLRIFFNFTPGCAYTEDEKLRLFDLDNGVKLEPEAIETISNLKSLMKTEMKCSFCTKAHGREDLILLEESKENKIMVNMLEQYISNLKNTDELLTCETCRELLESLLSVILKCLEVEGKINKYIELRGTDYEGRVDLKEVQQFIYRPVIKSEIESFNVDKLEDRFDQVQEEYTTMAEAEIKYEEEISKTELIVIKSEYHDIKSEQSDCDVPNIKSEKGDCDGFEVPFMENKSPSEIKTFQCEFCSYKAKQKSNLKAHILTHKSPSEIRMFKCGMCPYEAKHKVYVKRHLLTHRSSSELKMFKCELCSYETKLKRSLKRHVLTHKSPLEVEMFKCEMCPYEAKRKIYLQRHFLTHKSRSEIKTFKCELCSYEARQKFHLKSHLLTHKSRLEIKTFKCESCSYEAKHKSNLRRHLFTHKRPSE